MSRNMLGSPIPGVEIWRNTKNKFAVFQAHYTADPSKRDPAYIDPIRSAMPLAQFRQEFELVWESFIGQAVYPDWNTTIHGVNGAHPWVGLPLLMGIDQGLHPAAVICQLQEENLVVLKEYCEHNMGAERFSEYVRAQLRVDFPEWPDFKKDFLVGMDPTGFNRRDVDERTYAQVWAEHFDPFPGENLWEKRRQSVERQLVRFRKGSPCFRVNLDQCPVLKEGFEGGYRYPEHSAEVEPTKVRPVKDKYSQPHDALQYILTLLGGKKTIRGRSIPSPSYAWSKKAG